jgi:hypothetical protein
MSVYLEATAASPEKMINEMLPWGIRMHIDNPRRSYEYDTPMSWFYPLTIFEYKFGKILSIIIAT